MEDALVHPLNGVYHTTGLAVLILVLMEDALVRYKRAIATKLGSGLNPCFNGRCTRTILGQYTNTTTNMVLILVLMEDALVHGLVFIKAIQILS